MAVFSKRMRSDCQSRVTGADTGVVVAAVEDGGVEEPASRFPLACCRLRSAPQRACCAPSFAFSSNCCWTQFPWLTTGLADALLYALPALLAAVG